MILGIMDQNNITTILGTEPIILSFPHSGRLYPAPHLKYMQSSYKNLRSFEDPYLDMVLIDQQKYDANILINNCARAVIDVNRSLQNNMRAPILNGEAVGLIPHSFTCGKPLYAQKLHISEVNYRIKSYYQPYHQALKAMITRLKQKYAHILLVDCHSMPSKGADLDPDAHCARPDIILGDRYGTSASAHILDTIEESFLRQGLSVLRNYPYAGGHIVQNYGNIQQGVHAVQVEINRYLYVHEQNISLKKHHHHLGNKFQAMLRDVKGALQ